MCDDEIHQFEGTILSVSHDRYFLDRTAERLWILTPEGMADFDGNYSEWTEKLKEDERRAKQAVAAAKGKRG